MKIVILAESLETWKIQWEESWMYIVLLLNLHILAILVANCGVITGGEGALAPLKAPFNLEVQKREQKGK